MDIRCIYSYIHSIERAARLTELPERQNKNKDKLVLFFQRRNKYHLQTITYLYYRQNGAVGAMPATTPNLSGKDEAHDVGRQLYFVVVVVFVCVVIASPFLSPFYLHFYLHHYTTFYLPIGPNCNPARFLISLFWLNFPWVSRRSHHILVLRFHPIIHRTNFPEELPPVCMVVAVDLIPDIHGENWHESIISLN